MKMTIPRSGVQQQHEVERLGRHQLTVAYFQYSPHWIRKLAWHRKRGSHRKSCTDTAAYSSSHWIASLAWRRSACFEARILQVSSTYWWRNVASVVAGFWRHGNKLLFRGLWHWSVENLVPNNFPRPEEQDCPRSAPLGWAANQLPVEVTLPPLRLDWCQRTATVDWTKDQALLVKVWCIQSQVRAPLLRLRSLVLQVPRTRLLMLVLHRVKTIQVQRRGSPWHLQHSAFPYERKVYSLFTDDLFVMDGVANSTWDAECSTTVIESGCKKPIRTSSAVSRGNGENCSLGVVTEGAGAVNSSTTSEGVTYSIGLLLCRSNRDVDSVFENPLLWYRIQSFDKVFGHLRHNRVSDHTREDTV